MRRMCARCVLANNIKRITAERKHTCHIGQISAHLDSDVDVSPQCRSNDFFSFKKSMNMNSHHLKKSCSYFSGTSTLHILNF